jgi:plastocyanin
MSTRQTIAVFSAVLTALALSTTLDGFVTSVLAQGGSNVSIVLGASTLADKAWSPNPVNVKVGDTVTWTNDDNQAHTVTSGTGLSDPDKGFITQFQSVASTKANIPAQVYYCRRSSLFLSTTSYDDRDGCRVLESGLLRQSNFCQILFIISTHKTPLPYQLKGSYQWISCVIDYYVNSSSLRDDGIYCIFHRIDFSNIKETVSALINNVLGITPKVSSSESSLVALLSKKDLAPTNISLYVGRMTTGPEFVERE